MPFKKQVETKLGQLFRKIESALGVKTKTVVGLLVIVSLGFAVEPLFQKNDPTASSVMITNVTGNHGGSGVILDSNESESRILTNSHVCRVVEKGGMITGQAGTFLVTSYKHSETHDICLITVAGNMHAKTKVATRAPRLYYEFATISGHPALMPNVITSGHFSGRKVIEVMTGVRQCTKEDMLDPVKGVLCFLTGGIPEVKRYESILVTATIMGGSSGSAVYNENRELSGLAFAGSGTIGYAWTVPFEAVKYFLDTEERKLEKKKPSNSVDLFEESSAKKEFDEIKVLKKLKDVCSVADNRNKFKEVCGLVASDTTFIK